MGSDFVSVLLPTYNRPGLLKHLLACLNKQTFRNFEVVVTDNSSNEETQKLLETYDNLNIRYIKNSTNLGLQGNHQRALSEIRGDYFCFMGDDDLYEPDYIQKCVEFLKRHPTCSFLGTRFKNFKWINDEVNIIEPRDRYFPKETGELSSREVFKTYINGGNIGIRITGLMVRSDWYKLHQFEMIPNPQFDTILRLDMFRMSCNVGFIAENLHLARLHGTKRFQSSYDSVEGKNIFKIESYYHLGNYVRRHHLYLKANQMSELQFWLGHLWRTMRFTGKGIRSFRFLNISLSIIGMCVFYILLLTLKPIFIVLLWPLTFIGFAWNLILRGLKKIFKNKKKVETIFTEDIVK